MPDYIMSDKFIRQFLLEAQSHSGLPTYNLYTLGCINFLANIEVPDKEMDKLMDLTINHYMIMIHEIHNKTRKWKSYDW